MKDKFKSAVEKVYNSGELEKIEIMYKHGKTFNERVITKADKTTLTSDKNFLRLVNKNGFDKMPVIPLVMGINNADVWKSIIMFMLGGSGNE